MEARKRDLRTTGGQGEQEREPMERQRGKKRVYAGVEDEEGAASLQNTNETENRVMREQKSNSRIEICTWPAIGDKYSRVVLNRVIAE